MNDYDDLFADMMEELEAEADLLNTIPKANGKAAIFLDVDGVLNQVAIDGAGEEKFITNNGEMVNGHPPICEQRVANLARLINRGNSEIVLSSTWRQIFKPKDFEKIIMELCPEIPAGCVVGSTPVIDRAIRGEEVAEYLKVSEHENYIIIDDLPKAEFLRIQQSRLITTQSDQGLDASATTSALDVLMLSA